jgi:CRP-like cAMP-binding protein
LLALPRAQQVQLALELEAVHLQANQVLALPGQLIRYVYFPRNAVVSLLVPMEDGTAVECAIVGNEGLVGVQAFLGEGAGMDEIVVQLSGGAARMRVDVFRAAVTRSSELQTLLQHYMIALLEQIARTAGCNLVHSVEERCARWLLMCRDRVGTDTFPLTHERLADILGVRRASVTVAARALQNSGSIEYRRGSVTVLEPQRLRAVACEDYRVCKAAYDKLYDE